MENVADSIPAPPPRVAAPLADLFDLVSGGPVAAERAGGAHTLQVALRAFAASVGFAALYGVAAGCTSRDLVWQNAFKLPMVVVLAVVCSLPLGSLVWKVLGERSRYADLVMSTATGLFTATLVLACAAPLIALYYLTTEHVGGALVALVVASATAVGIGNGIRAGLRRRAPGAPIVGVVTPLAVLAAAMLAALIQLVHLASPIIPEQTVFDAGVEGIVSRPW
jgi:hypothetical protein